MRKSDREIIGIYICRELIDNCDLTTEEGQKFFKEKDFPNRICKQLRPDRRSDPGRHP